MFNKNIFIKNETKISEKLEINNPSTGELTKTHRHSKFIRFKKGSLEEKTLFSKFEEPHLIQEKLENNWVKNQHPKDYAFWTERIKIPHIVLQVIIFGNDEFLCEIINTELLNKQS